MRRFTGHGLAEAPQRCANEFAAPLTFQYLGAPGDQPVSVFGDDIGVGDADRKLLRIAAKAHAETGVPVITHTEAGTMGYDQVSFLVGLGVPPERVCLSHMDRNPDFWEHRRIAETGAYLGYDCPGKVKYGPDEMRIAVLKRMIEAGLGDRILLGNDLGRPSYWRSYGGGPGLDYVLTRFVPRLREEGVSDDAVRDLLENNPRRFLTGE